MACLAASCPKSPFRRKTGPRYLATFKAVDRKRWRTALKTASRARNPLPEKIVRWIYLTQPVRLRPRSRRSVSSWNIIPTGPVSTHFERTTEFALAREGSDRTVLAWFDGRPPETGKGKIRLAEAYAADGRNDEAPALIRDAWVNGKFPSQEERRVYRRHRKSLTLDDHAARLDRLLWDRQRSATRRMLHRVSADQKALGLARLALIESAGNVDWVIRQIPDRLKNHPGLVFERVRWRRKKGFDDRATELLIPALEELGRPSAWWPDRHILARKALAKGHVSRALRTRPGPWPVPRPSKRSEAEWLAGWIALRFLNDADAAFTHFYRVYQDVRYPISVARAAYWAGRAAMVMGFEATAQAWYSEARVIPPLIMGNLPNWNSIPRRHWVCKIIPFQRQMRRRTSETANSCESSEYWQSFVKRNICGRSSPGSYDLPRLPGEHELVAVLAQNVGGSISRFQPRRKALALASRYREEVFPSSILPVNPPSSVRCCWRWSARKVNSTLRR